MPELPNFYTNTHIPKAVAIQLRRQGIEIVRCEEVEMSAATDDEHLEYATQHSYIMVSCDHDFFEIDNRWKSENRKHTGIVHIHTDKCQSTGTIVRELVQLYELIVGGAGSVEEDLYNLIWRT